MIAERVATIRPQVRRFLLEAAPAPEDQRAARIGRLHERAETPGLVELLIDLEANRLTALDLAEALKDNL